MLREVRTHADRRRIPFAYLDVEIAEPAVERAWIRITHRLARLRTVGGEMQQVASFALLEIRCVRSQDDHGALRSITNQADPAPDVDGPRHAVPSLGNQHDAPDLGLLNAIDCLLQRIAVVAYAVPVHRKRTGREDHGGRIVRT